MLVKDRNNFTCCIFGIHVPKVFCLKGLTKTFPSECIKPRKEEFWQKWGSLFRARSLWTFHTHIHKLLDNTSCQTHSSKIQETCNNVCLTAKFSFLYYNPTHTWIILMHAGDRTNLSSHSPQWVGTLRIVVRHQQNSWTPTYQEPGDNISCN